MVRGDNIPSGFYRLVVHVCIFNSHGQLLIQQRQPFKQGWSNMWDVSVGGSSVAGEDSSTAASRELREELGIDYSFNSMIPSFTINFENGFDDFYIIEKELDPTQLSLQPEEVQSAKWASLEEILAMIDNGSFIAYQKSFIEFLFAMRSSYGILTGKDPTIPIGSDRLTKEP